MLGTGTDIVPNVPSFSVPVWTSYRRYRASRYRYGYHTERTELLGTGTNYRTGTTGTGTKYRTGTTGTGTNFVPNVPNFSVTVKTPYRMYRASRYGTEAHTGTGETGDTSGVCAERLSYCPSKKSISKCTWKNKNVCMCACVQQ